MSTDDPTAASDSILRGHGDGVLLEHIFSSLRIVDDVRVAALVCKGWAAAAAADLVWAGLCERVWADKVYVPERFLAASTTMNRRDAYFGSIADASRTALTVEELTEFE